MIEKLKNSLAQPWPPGSFIRGNRVPHILGLGQPCHYRRWAKYISGRLLLGHLYNIYFPAASGSVTGEFLFFARDDPLFPREIPDGTHCCLLPPGNWARWIRTTVYKSQSLVPYHLAIAQ